MMDDPGDGEWGDMGDLIQDRIDELQEALVGGPHMSLVKWVESGFLLDDAAKLRYAGVRQRGMIPIIELAALTELVEGLKACNLALESCKAQIRGALPRMEVESAIDESQRLLAQLEAHRKEGT